MKYFAILKDSLRETIDSKVFFAVIALSLFVIAVMATLSFEPNPPGEGLQKLAERFYDGPSVEVPLVGKVRVTDPFTQYTIEDTASAGSTTRPWATDYEFILVSRDQVPWGGREAVFLSLLE